jgi:hypothetical protein
MNNLETVEEAGAFVREQAGVVGSKFTHPEDDWTPVLFLFGAGIPRQPLVIALAEVMVDDESKEQFVAMLPSLLRKLRPRVACFLSSSWSVTLKKGEELEVRPSQDPERIEQLTLYVFGREREEMWFARIFRDGEQPPALQEWTEWTDQPGAGVAGRFAEAIREGLR